MIMFEYRYCLNFGIQKILHDIRIIVTYKIKIKGTYFKLQQCRIYYIYILFLKYLNFSSFYLYISEERENK